jgi:PAS domain S-box-containing protein
VEIQRAPDARALRALLQRGPWHLVLVEAAWRDPDPRGALAILAQAGSDTAVCVLDAGPGLHWIEAGARDCVARGDVRRIAILATAGLRETEEREEQRAHQRRLRKATQVLLSLSRSDTLRGHDLDAALREISEAAARAAQVARVGVWLHVPERRCLRVAGLYELHHDRHTSGVELAFDEHPEYFGALNADGHVVAHDAVTDPRTRSLVPGYLGPLGIGSLLDTVVTLRGRVVGVICLEHVGPARRWTLEDEVFASAIADLVSLALESAERHRAERLLVEGERRIRRVLENTSDLVTFIDVVDDTHFVCDSVNPAVARSTGLDPGHLVGKSPEQALPAPVAAMMVPRLTACVRSRQVMQYETEVPLPAGRRWYSTVLVPLVDDATGRVAQIAQIARDITEQKVAEAEIRTLARELERRVEERTAELAAANQELEAFAYSVSHDLRAPLRAIDGFSQALLEDYLERLDELGRDYLGRVRAATRRMGELIDALLELSRVSRGELVREDVDLSTMIAQSARQHLAADPGRDVALDVAGDVHVRADRRLLRVLVDNLVGNAVKYTRGVERAHIRFARERQGDEDVYVVRDDGAGFDPEYAGKLFQPFARLHRSDEFEGHGIGLATVHRIVRRHGGRVWAEGAVGRGAAFYFTLGRPEVRA